MYKLPRLLKKLGDNLKWAERLEAEEKIKLLRRQSSEESFESFLA